MRVCNYFIVPRDVNEPIARGPQGEIGERNGISASSIKIDFVIVGDERDWSFISGNDD